MIVIVGFLTIVIVGTILPFCLYLAAVKYAGSVYAGLLSSVEPVAATIVAAIFFRNYIPGNRYSGICTGIIYTFHFEYQFEINTGNKYR